MNKPVIGITVDCAFDPADGRTNGKLELNWNYAQAIAEAGGIPLLIPPQAEPGVVADIIDGWLIPGGNDIDASHWGEQNHPKVKVIEPERFDAERRLMDSVPPELPVLGICYGCQFINVAHGGSLEQHLPDVLGHDLHRGGTLQRYSVEAGSKLAEATGVESIEGKSYHHQAVGRPGAGLQVIAKDQEGVIEAIEATDRPWMIGVQWHPERTREDEATQRLFRSFVRAAAEYRAAKRGA
jgi:putative glutamine amidotransferase